MNCPFTGNIKRGLGLGPLQRDSKHGREGLPAAGEREAIAHPVDVQGNRHREMVAKVEGFGEVDPFRFETDAAHPCKALAESSTT